MHVPRRAIKQQWHQAGQQQLLLQDKDSSFHARLQSQHTVLLKQAVGTTTATARRNTRQQMQQQQASTHRMLLAQMLFDECCHEHLHIRHQQFLAFVATSQTPAGSFQAEQCSCGYLLVQPATVPSTKETGDLLRPRWPKKKRHFVLQQSTTNW